MAKLPKKRNVTSKKLDIWLDTTFALLNSPDQSRHPLITDYATYLVKQATIMLDAGDLQRALRLCRLIQSIVDKAHHADNTISEHLNEQTGLPKSTH